MGIAARCRGAMGVTAPSEGALAPRRERECDASDTPRAPFKPVCRRIQGRLCSFSEEQGQSPLGIEVDDPKRRVL
jgi:hypothetical protein